MSSLGRGFFLKKWVLFSVVSVFIFLLSACSDSGEKASTEKSKGLEASIESASYIISESDDGVSENENLATMAVHLKVKNLSDSPMRLSGYDGIKLYDGEQQININTELYNRDIGLDIGTGGSIGAGKSKTVLAIFEVTKDKEYEIGLNPLFDDFEEESEELVLKLDTKKYAASYETLQDPEKALKAYVDQIYYNKENPDYEQLVSADKPVLQESAQEAFEKEINKVFDKKLDDTDIEKLYATYRDILAEKAEVNATTIAHANDKAIVEVEVSTPSLQTLYEDVYEYKSEFRENTGSYDSQEIDKYVLSKLPKILNALEVNELSDPVEVSLTKKDRKWTIKAVDKYGASLDTVFVKGSIY